MTVDFVDGISTSVEEELLCWEVVEGKDVVDKDSGVYEVDVTVVDDFISTVVGSDKIDDMKIVVGTCVVLDSVVGLIVDESDVTVGESVVELVTCVVVLGEILQFLAIVKYSSSLKDWFSATSTKVSYMFSMKKGGQGADSKDGNAIPEDTESFDCN